MIRRSLALSFLTLLGPATGYAHLRPVQTAKTHEVIHVVRSGETLSLLAKRYGVSVAAVAEANHLAVPHHIRVGQKLVIPVQEEPKPKKAQRRVTHALGPPAHFVLEKPAFADRPTAFGWPVEGPVTSQFGRRGRGWHAGIDIKAEVGTPVFAAAPGTVYYSGWETRYGLVVKVEHPDGFVTIYAHNLQIFVEAWDEVYGGQVIATVGRTGHASTYHLHFEIRSNGRVYNPLHLLPVRDGATEPAAAGQPEGADDDEE